MTDKLIKESQDICGSLARQLSDEVATAPGIGAMDPEVLSRIVAGLVLIKGNLNTIKEAQPLPKLKEWLDDQVKLMGEGIAKKDGNEDAYGYSRQAYMSTRGQIEKIEREASGEPEREHVCAICGEWRFVSTDDFVELEVEGGPQKFCWDCARANYPDKLKARAQKACAGEDA